MKHYIIVTEGSQDVSVINNLLIINGFSYIKDSIELSKYSKIFQKLLPKSFPFIKESFVVWNVIPNFYIKDDKIVLLINPRGEGSILKRIDDYFKILTLTEIDNHIEKVLLFLDADDNNREGKINKFFDPQKKSFKSYAMKIKRENDEIKLIISDALEIDTSVFVLPENDECGTLEGVIVEAIQCVDNQLYTKVDKFFKNESISFTKDAEKHKALISCIGGILVPKGYSTAANIKEDAIKWISDDTLHLSCLNKINGYLKMELEL